MTEFKQDKSKQTQETLRQSEEMFRLMVDSVQDYSIYMLDENGTIASWNSGAQRAKGYTSQEIIGQNFSVFYSQSDIKSGKPQRNLSMAIRDGHFLDEGWRYRKDGTQFWASVVITPLKDRTGKLRGFAKVTRDMTAKKQAEDELEQQVRERTYALIQTNKELGQFAYVASHDLQEPLRMVAMYVDLLESRSSQKLDSEEQEFLKYAAEGAQRAQQLIRDLLQYSQVGLESKNFQPASFEAIIKSVAIVLQLALKDAQAEIETSPLPVLSVDASQITQLFQNLIANGLKYRSSEPVRIKIWAEEGAADWTFSVQDNGIGIAPEYYGKIFELFQRLHSKSKYPGTGLGLAICKKIVERHGGKIWVESEPKKGSTFKFTLPKQAGKQ